ncbi:two-component sensor histidine kinase [Wenxinia marina]|uniref:sensor histidine kinase n=1 Tax=Wenxinia marina TaxID=390641 RepID=UPI00037160FC|nr:ATP-binding protein [Wenxinia marina]GGL59429.1 two-component sensor histidine kinase [Wenxinia marina]
MRRLGIVALFLALVGGFTAGVWRVAYVAALEPLARRGQADLSLAADRLTGELQRFKELAVLMAAHPAVGPVLEGRDPAEAQALLRSVADTTGLLDLAILAADGRELAAASDASGTTHAGTAHFERALDGALGSARALPDRYRRRVWWFAAPVFSEAGPVTGAALAVVDVEQVEADWRGDRPAVWFTGPDGVIFLSNRSELLFRARRGDPSRIVQGPDFAAGQVTAFVDFHPRPLAGFDLWDVDGGPYLPDRGLHLQADLPEIGMVAEVLLDVAPARQLAALQAAAAAAICLAFGALLFLATERRRTLALANQRLEGRVAQRTAELQALNADLRREVAERLEAEARLKKAQGDLVQAAKLSALGEMSAGISHELNQPLMAIRYFADNARGFLARGRPEVADGNLQRIGEMARRMGRIIRNLRAFARQENEALSDIGLAAVIEQVVEMAEVRARAAGATILWTAPDAPLVVRAGEVRLAQVILNLVTNAIDAMEGTPERRVEITARRADGRAVVEVRDTGPGIAEPERIFDPFYTTKSVGGEEGMGLGLSISYGLVQSFGGAIRGRNRDGGGAVFTVELDLVERAAAA